MSKIGYEKKLVRNFSQIEPQKLGLIVLAGCFLVSLTFFAMPKPYAILFPTLSFRASMRATPTSLMIKHLDVEHENETQESKPRCDVANPRSDLCERDGVIRIHGNSSSTTFDASSGRDDVNSTQQLGIGLATQEKKAIDDGQISGRPEMDGDIRAQKNSSTTIIASIEKQETSDSKQLDATSESVKVERKPMCDVSNHRFDLCEMDGDIRVLGKSASIIFVTSSKAAERNESWRIRPYARKGDNSAMDHVREVTVKSSTDREETLRCTANHSVPAIIFSISGYTGNIFHDFTDVLIPLFLTSNQYRGEVQFVVTDMNRWWINKYLPILKVLSRYEIIDFDKDDGVHCFPHAIVGLRCHKELDIDPSKPPIGYSMVNFTQFMRRSYSLERETVTRIAKHPDKKPRLLIISRKRTRLLTNVNKIVRMAEQLGYEVVVTEADANIAKFAHIVNSCDVMMGVHGAGLTNLMFLPTNAILIQVVPWGGLQWISRLDFGDPSLDMKLRYLEYKISEEESSLIEQYPRDHPVFKDPFSIHKLGWNALSATFLDKQNVKLDVRRFRAVLLKAMKLLHQ